MKKEDINRLIDSNLADNDRGDITAEKMREVLHAINDYKVDYSEIENTPDIPQVADELGDSEELAISQRAVTDAVTAIENKVAQQGDEFRGEVQDLNKQLSILEVNKVDKIEGKGLSANDYTEQDKTKVEQLQPWALEKKKPQYTAYEVGALPIDGGAMQGNLDMNGHKVLNATLQVVDSLPLKAYDGQQVICQGVVYTFIDGVWFSEASDLIGHTGETHEENFVYQPTAGDLSVKDGFAEIKKIKGNTLVWNQLTKNGNFTNSTNEWVSYSANTTLSLNNDGSCRCTSSKDNNNNFDLRQDLLLPDSHKYYYKGVFKSSSNTVINPQINDNNTKSFSLQENVVTICKHIGVAKKNINRLRAFWVEASGDRSKDAYIDVYSFQLFDLTKMFGEGNEPSTVEEFEAMFPEDYYEYNEGTLISHDSAGIKTVGFNQFDKSKVLFNAFINKQGEVVNGSIGLPDNAINGVSDWIKVFPNTNYFVKDIISSYYMSCAAYDAKKNYIGSLSINATHTDGNIKLCSTKITTPNNAHYIRFGVSDKHIDSICINLSHTGYRNGEYQPYEEYTTQWYNGKKISELTSNGEVIFPDGLRSAGNVYDEITSDGKAIKRIGSVDMGSLAWQANAYNGFGTTSLKSKAKFREGKEYTELPSLLTSKYRTHTTHQSDSDDIITSIPLGWDSAGYIVIKDSSYTDAASFKASLQGQILYYELAEPVVYTLDEPINTSYEAYDFGSEEILYGDIPTPQIPMKADISYGFNAVDMIRSNYHEIQNLKERVTALETALAQIQASLVSQVNTEGDEPAP